MASKQRWFVVGAMLALASCSPSGSTGSPTTSVPPPEAPQAIGTATLPSIAAEPTGVPGLDAPDPFCAAWAAYAGTLQALGVAASFGDLPAAQLAALELVAAPRLSEVASAIAVSWPAGLDAERSVVIDQRIGPWARRAARALGALSSAGVDVDELDVLRSAWQTSLAAQNPDEPVIVPPGVPPALQAKVVAAAEAFDRVVTPFADDPSLAVDNVTAPATDQYLADHCPDLASIGVGDAL